MAGQGVQFRPSASERWINCTASVRAVASLPPDPGSDYANEGSAAHLLLDLATKERRNPHEYVCTVFPEYPNHPVSVPMANHVQETLDYIEKVRSSTQVLFGQGEMKVRIDLAVPGFEPTRGTADHLLATADGVLHVLDFKYGQGIKVHVRDNPQLLLYGLGTAQEVARMGYNPRLLHLHIMQPRLDHWDDHQYTMDEVAAFAVKAQGAVAEALSDRATFRPSKAACQWCAIKHTCRARAESMVSKAAPKFDLELQGVGSQRVGEFDFTRPAELTPQELGTVMHDLDAIQSWCSDVKEHCYSLAEKAQLPGWKLVAGRNYRQWVSEDAAKTQLALADVDPTDYLVTSLISPPQAEKLVSKKIYNEVIADAVTKKPGKPSLAPESDKRPAVGDVSSDFKNQETSS